MKKKKNLKNNLKMKIQLRKRIHEIDWNKIFKGSKIAYSRQLYMCSYF